MDIHLDGISDRQCRAIEKFKASIESLQKVIAMEKGNRFHHLQFPEFKNLGSVDLDTSKLEVLIDEVSKELTRDRDNSHVQKVKDIAVQWIRVSCPFTKILLTAAKECSAVFSH